MRTYSKGMVVYTVTNPAIAPIPNVMGVDKFCPGGTVPCTNCLRVVYVVKRTAEFAPIDLSATVSPGQFGNMSVPWRII